MTDGRNDGQPKSSIAPLFQGGAITTQTCWKSVCKHRGEKTPEKKRRYRSALAVNCSILIHCLEVSCKDQITSVQRDTTD